LKKYSRGNCKTSLWGGLPEKKKHEPPTGKKKRKGREHPQKRETKNPRKKKKKGGKKPGGTWAKKRDTKWEKGENGGLAVGLGQLVYGREKGGKCRG